MTSSRHAVRFWDTSALLQVYHRQARDHRKALALWSGPRARRVSQVTSVLVAIEAARRIALLAPDRIDDLRSNLRSMDKVELTAQILPIGYELAALGGRASGADRAILACALWLVRHVTYEPIELVSSDANQLDLARAYGPDLALVGLNPGT